MDRLARRGVAAALADRIENGRASVGVGIDTGQALNPVSVEIVPVAASNDADAVEPLLTPWPLTLTLIGAISPAVAMLT